ncbi:MAG TPA: zinc ribbon domain-containing protein [Pirellulales bacterium]|nr:zinc ribbon domain-containing protein [Pirellulales bacterium]
MADTKCKKCGAEIPAEAEFCPHCGREPGGIRLRHILFAIGAAILLALLIYGVFRR